MRELKLSLLLLSVPAVLEMIFQSLFSLAEAFQVSFLGGEAVAVIALTEALMTLVCAIGVGLGMATCALVARRIGEGDPERAAQVAGQSIILAGVVSALLSGVFKGFAPELLRCMGARESVVALGTDFLRVTIGGIPSVLFLIIINAILRGASQAHIAMRALGLALGVDLILAPCLISGFGPFPNLGIAGAAYAAVFGRSCGIAYQLWHLTGSRGRICLGLPHLRPHPTILAALLRLASTGVAQMLIKTMSWVGLVRILAHFGTPALAGYAIAIRITSFASTPAWGIANAVAVLVGQELGAANPSRAEAAAKIAVRFNLLVYSVAGTVLVFGAPFFVRLLASEPESLALGTEALWIISLAAPINAAGLCYAGAFNGAGDIRTPTGLNLICLGLCQLTFALLLTKTADFGATGVFLAVPIAQILFAVWISALFRRGRWKRKQL